MNIKKYTEKDRYGNMFSYEFDVPSMQEIPQPDPEIFKPKGTDTVPAMLTPGENVINAEASRLPGVQPMLDELNDVGRAIQKKQGGPIPSYKQEGGVIVDDAMLDAIKKVESGGDPQALSGVGAGGQYQIMPKTALQPGYGVTPITLEERFDPNISRNFAKEYLQGIIKKHPEFTKDQVLTAYHSGVGNVLKDNIGPEGKAYAPKVNAAMSEIPMITYDMTEQKPGMMSAQASTSDIPPKEDISFLDSLRKKIDETFPSIAEDETIKKRRKKNERKTAAIEEKIAKEGTLFSDGLNDAEKDLSEFKKELVKKGSNVTDSDAEKLKALTEKRNSLKTAYEEKVKQRKEAMKPTEDEIKAKEKIDILLGKKSKSEKIEEQKKAAQVISDQLANEEDIDQTVMTNEEVSQYIKDNPGKTIADKFIDKGKEVGGVILDKSMEYFKDAFSSMFDGEELARMALIYAGSRAMGYNHGASLNYGMKNYIKRVDANQAYAKKAVLDKDFADRYTAESLAKYSKSADVEDLVPKSTAVSLQTVSGNVYIPGYGKATTFKGDDKVEYVTIEGMKYPASSIKGIEKFDEKVHGDATVAKRYDTFGKAFADAINKESGLEPGDDGYVAYRPIGSQANSIYRKILRQNGVNINDAPQMQMAVERAMGKFLQAQSDYRSKKTTIKPNNLESFVNMEVFTPLTGISQAFISGTSPENLAKINKMIKNGMENKNPRSPKYVKEYYNDWQGTLEAYKKLPKSERDVLIKEAAEKSEDGNKWSAFTLWVSRTSPDKIEELIKQ